jgi:hypothetical protein
MIDVDVLSTAAGLREFDAATVAAYCRADENQVVLVLTEHEDLFVKRTPRHGQEPAVTRWRVTNAEGLRERISFSRPANRSARRRATSQARTFDLDNPQLHNIELDHGDPVVGADEPAMALAEQSLLACAQEPDAGHRHLLASRAMNCLSQCISAIRGDDDQIESFTDTSALPTRLRFDLALAALTLSDTTGQGISRNLLLSAYDDATSYAESNLPDREAHLLRRFRELAASQSADHLLDHHGEPTHRADFISD